MIEDKDIEIIVKINKRSVKLNLLSPSDAILILLALAKKLRYYKLTYKQYLDSDKVLITKGNDNYLVTREGHETIGDLFQFIDQYDITDVRVNGYKVEGILTMPMTSDIKVVEIQ